MALPISSGGIRLISFEFTVLLVDLGNWALIAHVIAFRFLLDSHPFLLEVIGVNNSFPF